MMIINGYQVYYKHCTILPIHLNTELKQQIFPIESNFQAKQIITITFSIIKLDLIYID